MTCIITNLLKIQFIIYLRNLNFRVRMEKIFNLNWEDVFSASDDHVLAPTDDSEVAIFIQSGQIPNSVK